MSLGRLLLMGSLLFVLSACDGGDSSGSGGEPPASGEEAGGGGPGEGAGPGEGGDTGDGDADLPSVSQRVTFEASDGKLLQAIITAREEVRARPLIVEFSPYGLASGVPDFGPDYNHVFVHARGSGNSQGVWSAVGPRDQQDISEFLAWACEQPWSDGRIGLYGFSASAIAIYNSMHLPLACVKAAALMAGTNELYRDLLYPGGMPNLVPAAAVGAMVGLPLLASLPDRAQRSFPPLDMLESGLGFLLDLAPNVLLLHPTLDDYWQARTQRPGPNTFPVLADTGFYDVESRGPFESYKMLRAQGVPVHLRVFGAHDGFPEGAPLPQTEYRRWFDRFVLGRDNGIDREPRVQFLLGHGSYEAMMAGEHTLVSADDWPVPGTRWQPLFLDPARGGGAFSSNDGTLSVTASAKQALQPYPAITSLATATDPYTTSLISAGGASVLFKALPFLIDPRIMEPLSLTYTTSPLRADVDMAGPASLRLYLSSLLPESDIQAVLADVWPDGSAHPVATGRLRTSYPKLVEARTVRDADGEIVQPYADHGAKTYALPGQTREYHVEFWPVGNRFQAGHRLRLYLTGAATFMLPAPNLNIASVGGATPSRLMLPVLPGSDLASAVTGAP